MEQRPDRLSRRAGPSRQVAFAVVSTACALASAAAGTLGILWARSTGPAEAAEARHGAAAARALAAVLSSLDEIEEALRSRGGGRSSSSVCRLDLAQPPRRPFSGAGGAQLLPHN